MAGLVRLYRWSICAAALAISWSSPVVAAPTIRALFVGIDHYRYSKARLSTADFNDLRGAVGDVGRFKDALRAAHRLDLDAAGNDCRSANAVSITLTDDCATRAAMLAALEDRIAASAAGDTLIFYFAGHGSRITDDQLFDQGSGMNDTILPTDARQPGATSNADILDRELRGYIDQATAKGVNVVTIFDSCNSGTGTRGERSATPGETRDAPALSVHGLQRPPPPALRGPGGGYRVHLAAAADWQLARETPPAAGDDTRRGVFTTALADAMRTMPTATFGDLAFAARTKVAAAIGDVQTPQAEGALNATMGGPDRSTPLFDVTVKGAALALTAGRLSGITQGSKFALYASASDALADGVKPVATAIAEAPDAYGAPLTLTEKPAATLPARLVARETAHAWGDSVLRVSVLGPTAVASRVGAALAKIPFVRTVDQAPFRLAATSNGIALFGSANAAFGAEGAKIAELGPLDDAFDARLDTALRRVARGELLLALANDSRASRLCVAEGDYDVFACPPLETGSRRMVELGATLKLTVANAGPGDRYVYVLVIDDGYGITLLVPRNRGNDPKVPADQPQQRSFKLDTPGLYRFVTITSSVPINAAALEQPVAGARDAAPPTTSDWTANVTEVIVRPGGR